MQTKETEVENLADLIKCAKQVEKEFLDSTENVRRKRWRGFKFSEEPLNNINVLKYGEPVWYRGDFQFKQCWDLCPPIFRGDWYLEGMPGRGSVEKWLLTDFIQKAPFRDAHCPTRHDAYAAWLALAQHHRLPTRLLDWSQSLLHAAWFATHEPPDHKCDNGEGSPDDEDHQNTSTKVENVVWALSPGLLNDFVRHDGPVFIMKDTDDLVHDAFRGHRKKDGPPVLALTLQDVHPRMMMQHGAFTIHARPGCLSKLNSEASSEIQFLQKIILKTEDTGQFQQELATAGVSESTIYPDLDHLASDLKRLWKSRVDKVKGD